MTMKFDFGRGVRKRQTEDSQHQNWHSSPRLTGGSFRMLRSCIRTPTAGVGYQKIRQPSTSRVTSFSLMVNPARDKIEHVLLVLGVEHNDATVQNEEETPMLSRLNGQWWQICVGSACEHRATTLGSRFVWPGSNSQKPHKGSRTGSRRI